MTAANSYSKKKFSMKLLKNEIRSHWWLMMINGILYLSAGPLVLWMILANITRDGYFGTDWARTLEITNTVNEWFCYSGFISYYVIAMVMGAMLPVILFGYLNSKKQTNFYHSMPISRNSLFVNNTLTGIAVMFIPMLVAVLAMIAVVLVYGQWSDINFGYIIGHLGYIFLYFMLSYSLALLATQLTGTVLTQIAMTGVLHFGVIALCGCTFLAKSVFYSTYVEDIDALIYWSPITNFVMFANNMHYRNFTFLPWQQLGIIVAITIVAIVLAWIGYRKRPSESATQPIVYEIVKPILKFAVMYCAVCLCGILFMEIGGPVFLFVGIVIAAILVQMFMEIIYNKDFRAMFQNKRSFAAMLVVLLGIYGGMFFDVTGYDTYVPKDDKIAYIKADIFNLDSNSYYFHTPNGLYEEFGARFEGEKDIAMFTAWIRTILEDGNFRRNEYRYDNSHLQAFNDKSMSVEVCYVLESGKEVRRYYRSIPTVVYVDQLAGIYESESYKNSLENLLAYYKKDKIIYYAIEPAGVYYWRGYESYNVNEKTIATDPYLDELYQAMMIDLPKRTGDTLKEAPLYSIHLETNEDGDASRYRNNYGVFVFQVYPDDKNLVRVMEKMKAAGDLQYVDKNDLVQQVEKLDIYTVEANVSINALAYDQFADKDIVDSYQAVLQKTVTDEEEIRRIIDKTVTASGYHNAPFMELDKHVVVKGKVQYVTEQRDYTIGIDGEYGWTQVVQQEPLSLFYKQGECPYQFN